jgi:hypothetical protein
MAHCQDLNAPLRLDAQRKINGCRQQFADNQNISFLRLHEHIRPHARRVFASSFSTGPPGDKTEAHFTAAGMSSQRNQSDSFRFKRAAFYQSLKSKGGLAAAKTAALRINLNVDGCGIVAAPVHAPPSRAALLLPLLLSHNLPLPRVH